VVTTVEHLDLRDKRMGAGISIDALASFLYGPGEAGRVRPAISRWERGINLNLPGDKTRRDYERALKEAIEAARRSAEGE
jgi:hypothetical protein